MSRRGERPGHSATTAHFQAAYPFLGQGGIGAPGAYIGTDAFGGAWAFDPWELYARKAVRSPNMIVMGDIAHLKSTPIKTFLYRGDRAQVFVDTPIQSDEPLTERALHLDVRGEDRPPGG